MKIVFFWTDLLVWLFFALSVLLGWFKRHSPLLQDIKRTILNQTRYMLACFIVLCFVTVGLLDSIHLQFNQGAIRASQSLLDQMLSPRDYEREKTYSAPFALRGFTEDLILNPDGQLQEVYPELNFAGKNLINKKEKWNDILTRFVWGGLAGCGIMLALFLGLRRRINRKMPPKVARAFWIALFILISLIMVARALMFEYHIFGTDKVGRDVFYIALKSIRTGLVIGTVTSLVMLPFALSLGIWAGYFRGWVDDVIQYLYTTLGSIPGVLLIAAAVLSFQVKIEEDPDLKLVMLCIILGATGWIGLCRLLRGETLKLREADYVLAARVLGVSHTKILLNHILPNVMHIVVITVVLDFSGLVLAESVLSYIGVGVSPTTYSWGNMINAARLEMAREPVVWWSLTASFLFMFTLVFSANILGDAVQEALNPKSH